MDYIDYEKMINKLSSEDKIKYLETRLEIMVELNNELNEKLCIMSSKIEKLQIDIAGLKLTIEDINKFGRLYKVLKDVLMGNDLNDSYVSKNNECICPSWINLENSVCKNVANCKECLEAAFKKFENKI